MAKDRDLPVWRMRTMSPGSLPLSPQGISTRLLRVRMCLIRGLWCYHAMMDGGVVSGQGLLDPPAYEMGQIERCGKGRGVGRRADKLI